MKIRKYVVEETEQEGWDCTSTPDGSVTPKPRQVTPDTIAMDGRVLAVQSFDEKLMDWEKLEFYENVLGIIARVGCEDPSGCALAALKIRDLETIRD